MQKLFTICCFVLFSTVSVAQIRKNTGPEKVERPKLVVGLVIDQMRWDYLYRYYNRYGEGGFKRLLHDGFSCENTLINYIPSFTAVGHTTIFTGSVPAFSGITGNDWIDQLSGRKVYCTDDSTVVCVGAEQNNKNKMSPRNMLVSTLGDEMRIASNFTSKVVGVSLKDRASILPAGHTANAAFWLDDASGNFITSSYYMNELPAWVKTYNQQNKIQSLLGKGWNTLYPINTYLNSDADNKVYEGTFAGETTPTFPHSLQEALKKDKGVVRSTPFGNTLTLDFAKAALSAYQLGKGEATDFLTINCASTDYVGHMFGPNSIEVEDTYLRLDQDLAALLKELDAKVGKGQYLIFLTSDHGAAHAIGFMQEHSLPADYWSVKGFADDINKALTQQFGVEKLVLSATNYQLNFNLVTIDAKKLDLDAIKKAAIAYAKRQPGISYAIDMDAIGSASVPEPLKSMTVNGYYFKRSGAVQLVLEPGWFSAYGKTGTTHGTWNPYDSHIPLLFYGWKVKHGKTNRETYMTDIAATVAALLRIQMPNGNVGKVITEVVE